MRFFHAAVLVTCLLLAVGVGGTVRNFGGERNVVVYIADNDSAYIAFKCLDANLKGCCRFRALIVTNNLNDDATFYFSSPNLEFPSSVYIRNGETKVVEAEYLGGNGSYTIPVMIYAVWYGGSAKINCCIHVSCLGCNCSCGVSDEG